jgi:hypothetical protein
MLFPVFGTIVIGRGITLPVEDTNFYGMSYCSDLQTAADVL